jgi:hypothetical protein
LIVTGDWVAVDDLDVICGYVLRICVRFVARNSGLEDNFNVSE